MKTTKMILGLALAFTIWSCSKEDGENSTLSEAKINAKIDAIADDVSDIVEKEYYEAANLAGRNAQTQELALPDCVTVTVTGDLSSWTRTLVFANCTMPNGNVLDGTIIISGSTDFDAPTQTINYSFVNFHHNNILVEGNRSMVRTLQSTAALATIHPVANVAFDMQLTFPNGNTYHRVGNRVREMIAGFNTPLLWLDNVFSITGSWTTTFPSGTRTSTITTPLVAEATCPYLVSGVITVVGPNNTATLDYGNGDCDNQATLTVNGTTTTIFLGN
ncbi:hypothetical protein [Flavobacterium sedimenticola]|uniref:Lipoprotein n=1 Tax=Flavobacterium sedimenticola TaxID=3043286 RepID=A0ABT6XRU3_9FLAO|nr:hypothetical protein [Flavobacterium sedimenticola]MDI9257795.1 hypothetical protein [Flavobacterium sedimenticola]